MQTHGSHAMFTKEVLELLEETFENVSGHFLDRTTSLFETLEGVSAEKASRVMAGNGETVAAHVFHLRFYLDVLRQYITGTLTGPTDWSKSWTLRSVDETEWRSLVSDLRASYEHIREMIRSYETWEDEDNFSGAVAVIAHSAFHLASIRQILQNT